MCTNEESAPPQKKEVPGKEVMTLVDEGKSAGAHEVQFSAQAWVISQTSAFPPDSGGSMQKKTIVYDGQCCSIMRSHVAAG